MKKILVMPDGNWLSHTSRPFEISKQLKFLGHQVVFAGEGEYMKLPRNYGFEVIPVKTIDPDHVLRCSRSGRVNWFNYDLICEGVESDLELFNKVKPDMVLTDFRLTAKISCELAKIPLSVILNASWTDYTNVRFNSPEHLPITGVVGQRIANLLLPWVKDLITTYDNRPFNKFRKEKGLKPTKNIWETWKGDLNLLVDIPQFTPTVNLPKNFHYIGPIYWEPDSELPSWYYKLDETRPTLYFTMGSTGYTRFFDEAVDLFGNTKFQCIITTAGMVNEEKKYPDNFFVVEYAPGSKLLEKSDVVVCHGGNGTIYQAMAMGVPIIGIPTMHDQEYNLDRVEALGLGIHLSELKFEPIHLRQAVNRIFNEKKYHKNALAMKEVMASYNGPKSGAMLIDEFLKS